MHIQMTAAVLKISIRIDGREGKRVKYSEECRGKRCSLDTNTEGAHSQSYLMTHENTEIPNWEQSLGQYDGNNPLSSEKSIPEVTWTRWRE